MFEGLHKKETMTYLIILFLMSLTFFNVFCHDIVSHHNKVKRQLSCQNSGFYNSNKMGCECFPS